MPTFFQRKTVIIPLLALTLLWLTTSVHALTLGFQNISNNLAGDAAIGEAQLFVDITDTGGNQVLFTFRNEGPAASSITDVYFDDGSLLSIADLIDADQNGGDPGVDFSQLANPSNLPSANSASPPFVTTAGFSADSDPPVASNGVNPLESLGVLFNLQGGQTFDDTIAALGDGSLRIGIHVQAFATGGSESFVNTPVPEPSTLLLFGSGLVALALWGRKRLQTKN